jgi:hypothetical protein
MYYLSAQPDSSYFIWQLEVQINNFRKFNLEKSMIILIGYDPVSGVNPYASELKNKTIAKIFYYPDNRDIDHKKYLPTIRPFLLRQFFLDNPNHFHNKPWMYHDGDIIFRKLPKIKGLRTSNKIYVSDTRSYLDSGYVKSKSKELFLEMCKIVKIRPELVEGNDINCGGAQYVFGGKCGMGAYFWDKVYDDCLNLYNFTNGTIHQYSPLHPIQAWTADMWAVIWNMWLMGFKTEISRELSFSFATDNISNWLKHNIFHNAGVLANNTYLFYKGNYINKLPFNEDFSYISRNHCSFKYVEEIMEIKK